MSPRPVPVAVCLLLCGCAGEQSALAPAGRDAERIAELFTWMVVGGAVIWAAVLALAVYASRGEEPHSERKARLLILGGGAIVPTVVLTVLLVYGLALMPPLLHPGPPDGLRVRVSGEQWWWRVRYVLPDGGTVETANLVALPVGERSLLILESPDVIHSFWVPSLAGKMDLIPGRTTLLPIEPTRLGVYRGACAEYCGASHAEMNLHAIVLSEADFAAWLAAQQEPAREPEGATVFLANGCGACHTVRGTPADGVIGPDLTHVGSRPGIAGVLDNDVDGFVRWITDARHLKPEVHMPTFDMLPPEDVRALATWLEDLD